MKLIILFAVICYVARTHANLAGCFSKTSCDECITSQCMWCTDPELTVEPKCLNKSAWFHTSCPRHHIYNPKNALRTLLNNEFPSSNHGFHSSLYTHSSIKISKSLLEHNYMNPKYLRVEMIPDEEFSFQINYVHAENVPIDIYLIMDLRKSDEHKAEELYNLASKLEETLRKITSNFKVGLGYIDNNSSFKHQMTMSRNTNYFLRSVRELSILGTQEASNVYLDAIFLSVCSMNVGWRATSHKYLIFATNTDYQYDNVHAPITDQICNENFDVLYTRSQFNPYPDIWQINNLLINSNVKLIFAVNNNLVEKYKKLQFQMDFSAIVELNVNSLNITDVITDLHKELYTQIKLKENAPNYMKIKFYSNCLNKTGIEQETNVCNFIKGGDSINYTVKVRALSCPDDNRYWLLPLDIYLEGLHARVAMEIKLICSCPTFMQQFSENSKLCNGQGRWEDGVCKCNETYFGDHCECSGSNQLQDQCRAHDSDQVDCNGSGKCICGKCECETHSYKEISIHGKFCECNDYDCVSKNEILCSGNGECDCGTCKCKTGWTGALCEHEDAICKKQGDTNLCSGHGKCEDGKCNCHSDMMNQYYGEFCEQFQQMRNDSNVCNRHGVYENGVCTCTEQYFGNQCECNGNYEMSSSSRCRPDNITLLDCSGRGQCICGVCECKSRENKDEFITGMFCECDNYSCDRHEGKVCSGPDHGQCLCGQCECISPWTGPSCSNNPCISPNTPNATLCSGRGYCNGKSCDCKSGVSGKFCEDSLDVAESCSKLKDCVECQIFGIGPLSEGECDSRCTFVPIMVETVKVTDDNEHLCVFNVQHGCSFIFKYILDEYNRYFVTAQTNPSCPPNPDYYEY